MLSAPELLFGELSCWSRVMNAQAADMWVVEVVIPEKEERKTVLSALRAWGPPTLPSPPPLAFPARAQPHVAAHTVWAM